VLPHCRYPNLAYETSPAGILATLTPHVPRGSVLYMATNEPDPATFFAPLRERYHVRVLQDFDEVVHMKDFIASSVAILDYSVLDLCAHYVPTFASEKSRGFEVKLSLSQSLK
jgi:hypothetical protein